MIAGLFLPALWAPVELVTGRTVTERGGLRLTAGAHCWTLCTLVTPLLPEFAASGWAGVAKPIAWLAGFLFLNCTCP